MREPNKGGHFYVHGFGYFQNRGCTVLFVAFCLIVVISFLSKHL